jgi:lipopolysaccharide/colanic/teichoic acid biosynthesis glycosyltransferase
MRRVAEVVIACALLGLTLPLMAVIALAVKYENPGPILSRSLCFGSGGRRFNLLRFRVTRNEPGRSSWVGDFTRVGEFLHYTRLEDLPMLFNVLRGDISLLESGPDGPSFLV